MKAMEPGRVCESCFYKMSKGKLKCPGWHGWDCNDDAKDCGILNNDDRGVLYKTGEFLKSLKKQKARIEKGFQ